MPQLIVEHARLAPAPRPARPAAPPASEPPRRVDSATLLGGARRLTISHEGEVYTLHLTRQNKLLLTK